MLLELSSRVTRLQRVKITWNGGLIVESRQNWPFFAGATRLQRVENRKSIQSRQQISSIDTIATVTSLRSFSRRRRNATGSIIRAAIFIDSNGRAARESLASARFEESRDTEPVPESRITRISRPILECGRVVQRPVLPPRPASSCLSLNRSSRKIYPGTVTIIPPRCRPCPVHENRKDPFSIFSKTFSILVSNITSSDICLQVEEKGRCNLKIFPFPIFRTIVFNDSSRKWFLPSEQGRRRDVWISSEKQWKVWKSTKVINIFPSLESTNESTFY